MLIGFLQGETPAPHVIGGVWRVPDPPQDPGEPAERRTRLLTLHSGHVIRLDDTGGGEKIEVIDQGGRRRVVIDSASRRIRVEAGEGDVEISAPKGTITLSGKGIEIDTDSGITVNATHDGDLGAVTSVRAAADATLSVRAAHSLTIRGSTVEIS